MLKIKHAGRLTKKIKQLMYPTDFHSIFIYPTMEFNGAHQLSGYQQKKEIYTVLKQLE